MIKLVQFLKVKFYRPLKVLIRDIKVDSYHVFLYLNSFFLNKKIYIVIGDSHSRVFYYNYPFVVYHIGGATAFNVNNEKSTINTKSKVSEILSKLNKKRHKLVFSFGEIDCRIHVYRQYVKSDFSKDFSIIIDDIVSKYIHFIKEHNSKFEVIILGIPSPGKQPNVYRYDNYADFDTQWKIKNIFNEKLKKACKDIGVRYIDIFTEFMGDDNFIDLKYCDDGVHLNENSISRLKSSF